MATPDLLGMPPEILSRILRHCLVVGVVAKKVHSRFSRKPLYRKPSKTAVPVLRTCKVVYEIGLPIFYGENIFYFQSFHGLKIWLGKQRIYNKGLVRHVLVWDNKGACNDKVRPWYALPGLKSYNILKFGPSKPTMPQVTFMRRMWREEGQQVDIGVVVRKCCDNADNGILTCNLNYCEYLINADLSGAEMKLYNVVARGTRQADLVFELELDKAYSADEMHYTLIERRCRK